jgi:hypothetical protein
MARVSGVSPKPGSRHSQVAGAPDPQWATHDQIAALRGRLKTKEAVWWFDLVSEDARRSGTLTVLDLATFQHWADNQGTWEIANEQFHDWLRTLPPPDRESPKLASVFPRCYSIRNRCMKEARDLEAQMGFSPSARTRIKAAQAQTDMFDELALTVGINYLANIPERAA